MASQLKVDTLTGVTTAGSIDVTGEGNSTTTNLQQGLCKCWGLDNEGANPDTDSFNVASSTDNGTGDYTKTFTNGFATGDRYCFVGTSNENTYSTIFISAKAAGSIRITNENISGAAHDIHTGYQIDGDLA